MDPAIYEVTYNVRPVPNAAGDKLFSPGPVTFRVLSQNGDAQEAIKKSQAYIDKNGIYTPDLGKRTMIEVTLKEVKLLASAEIS